MAVKKLTQAAKVAPSKSVAKDEEYGVPDHKPNHCCWPTCAEVSGPSYLGRKLCDFHFDIVLGQKYPQQRIVEALNLPPTPEESVKWQGLSADQREKKVKGLKCETCGRNCPDVGPDSTKVWCHVCVMAGKHRAGTETKESRSTRTWLHVKQLRDLGRTEEAAALEQQLLAAKTTSAKRVGASKEPREPNATETMMQSLASGKESYVWEGTKAVNVFTQGQKAGTIAVQDHKGVTTYDLADADHNRIIKGRIDRWVRKTDPKVKQGKVPVKGQKLEVVVKS